MDMGLMLIELSMIVIVIWSFIINKKLILTPEVVAKRNRKKNQMFNGQADRKGWPPTLRSAFHDFFWVCEKNWCFWSKNTIF